MVAIIIIIIIIIVVVIVVGEDESRRSGMAGGTPKTKVRSWSVPASLSLPLPNTKQASTPTQQHGRPRLRDSGATQLETRTDPSGHCESEGGGATGGEHTAWVE